MTPRSRPDRAPLRALADVAADEPALRAVAARLAGATAPAPLAVPEAAPVSYTHLTLPTNREV